MPIPSIFFGIIVRSGMMIIRHRTFTLSIRALKHCEDSQWRSDGKVTAEEGSGHGEGVVPVTSGGIARQLATRRAL